MAIEREASGSVAKSAPQKTNAGQTLMQQSLPRTENTTKPMVGVVSCGETFRDE
jgi:hypothetical protein